MSNILYLKDLIQQTDNQLFVGLLEEFYSTLAVAVIPYEITEIADLNEFVVEVKNTGTIHVDKLAEIINQRWYFLRTKLDLLIRRNRITLIQLPKDYLRTEETDEGFKIIFSYKLVREEK